MNNLLITRTILYKILPLLVVVLNKNIEYRCFEFWHIMKYRYKYIQIILHNRKLKLNNFLCKIHCPLYPHHLRGRSTTVTVFVDGRNPVVMIAIGVAQGKIALIIH